MEAGVYLMQLGFEGVEERAIRRVMKPAREKQLLERWDTVLYLAAGFFQSSNVLCIEQKQVPLNLLRYFLFSQRDHVVESMAADESLQFSFQQAPPPSRP